MGALEWQMAIEWICSTDIEPAIKQATLEKIDTLLEFAQSLRTGHVLCLVANSLKPGCIKDISKVNNINMHEVKMVTPSSYTGIFFCLFLYNIISINIFVQAFYQALFGVISDLICFIRKF